MSNLKVDRTAKEAFLQLPLTNGMALGAAVLNGNLQNKLWVERKTTERKRRKTMRERENARARERQEHAQNNEELYVFNLLESAILFPSRTIIHDLKWWKLHRYAVASWEMGSYSRPADRIKGTYVGTRQTRGYENNYQKTQKRDRVHSVVGS